MSPLSAFTVIGAIGGLVAWLLGEFLFGAMLARELSPLQRFVLDAGYGWVTGVSMGFTFGVGQWTTLRRRWLPMLAAALGGLGGVAGLLWGETLYQLLRFAEVPARVVGWCLVGFAVGSSQGVVRGSVAGALRAGFGGALGGGIGGALFAWLPTATSLPDPTCRGLAWVLMGALIGSASALFERLLANATLKVASGKLEGKEFVLDKPRLVIGRDERCDIALYYDAAVLPRHATLEWAGDGYRIAPIGQAAVTVNGHSAPVKTLHHNDVLVIGNTRLVYRLRAGAASAFLCAACYAANRKDAKFCRHCGRPFVPLKPPESIVAFWSKQALTALGVLAICLSVSFALGNRIGHPTALTGAALPLPADFGKGQRQRSLRLAVTPAGYDDIGSVLHQMGFETDTIDFADLHDVARLRRYDAVFVNCHQQLQGFRDGHAIAQYVAEGGVLYASDYACDVVQAAFHRTVAFGRSERFALWGETVNATVVDPTLADVVGGQVRLHFDLPAWRYVTAWQQPCRVYLTAGGWESQRVLLVSFPYGKGFVVYTAFHNKAQPTGTERRLIEFLALRPLTMHLARQLAQVITQPTDIGALGVRQNSGLLTGQRMVLRREIVGTIGDGRPSPVYRFALAQPSPLKIVVGWEGGDGAFAVALWSERAPQRRWERQGRTMPLVLSIPEPLPAGTYCLQLRAVQAPLPQTPFVIGVGMNP